MASPMQNAAKLSREEKQRIRTRRRTRIIRNWDLYLIVLVPLTYIVIFHYIPMYGAQIAFRNFRATQGILGSEWVGLKHIIRFIKSFKFGTIFGNTLSLSFYQLIAGFPMPIILALALHYAGRQGFKKSVQMITYAPHFISTVVIVGMLMQVLALRGGIVNTILGVFGIERINFMGKLELFQSIYVWSDVWQQAGWGSIIYLAALASIDTELHEAAIVDGAVRVQRIWHIDLPGILPTVTILLILRLGRIMQVGFEKVLLMQNPLNLTRSEIIQTYVYKIGLASAVPNYSYAAAIGLFAAAISFLLLIIVNRFAKTVGETSLW